MRGSYLTENLPTLRKREDGEEWLAPIDGTPPESLTVMRALFDKAVVWGALMQEEKATGKELGSIAWACLEDADTEGRICVSHGDNGKVEVFRPALHFAVHNALKPWEHHDELVKWYENEFEKQTDTSENQGPDTSSQPVN